MLKHFVIFGAPGSGKGTQARRLVKRFGLFYIGTGDLMRAEAAANTDLGRKIKLVLEDHGGILMDDKTANEMVDHKLIDLSHDQSAIFDGYPRTIPQAEHLAKYFEKTKNKIIILNLEVDLKNLLDRTATRRICEKCRKPFQNPAQLGIDKCDECDSKLVVRPDDKPEIVKNRLEVYAKQTKPLLDFYRKNGQIIEVDGNPPIDEVWDEIETKVQTILKDP